MSKKLKNQITAIVVLVVIVALILFSKRFFEGKINSVEQFQEYIETFGILGPIVLGILQAVQVVVPVLPGMVGSAAGAIMFGTWMGFWVNYIGISVGSIIAYYLARIYGIDIILLMFPEKLFKKWSKRIEKSKSFGVFLFVATLLPLFPDDFLCYFSGLIKMNAKKFFWIIVLGKPWCILAYSIIFGMVK